MSYLLSVYGCKNDIDLTEKTDLFNNIYNDLGYIFQNIRLHA